MNVLEKATTNEQVDYEHALWVLKTHLELLKRWKTDYQPKTMDEQTDERFLYAVHTIDHNQLLLDWLQSADDEKRNWVFRQLKSEKLIQKMENCILNG